MIEEQTPGRILIVDDEEAVRFFVAEALKRDGWHVGEADSGEMALVFMADRPYDVVLLDLRMAGMDGVTVMQEIKAEWPLTMVIIMTAYASIESAIEAVRHGAFDYLRKPSDTQDILDCVRRAWQKRQELIQQQTLASSATAVLPPTVTADEVQTGALHIHLGARTVSLSGEIIPLTPTEYELLALLAETMGTAVPRSRLISRGLGYDPNDTLAQETLRVHISRMRRKLESDYIVTVRGGGYLLVDLPPSHP